MSLVFESGVRETQGSLRGFQGVPWSIIPTTSNTMTEYVTTVVMGVIHIKLIIQNDDLKTNLTRYITLVVNFARYFHKQRIALSNILREQCD